MKAVMEMTIETIVELLADAERKAAKECMQIAERRAESKSCHCHEDDPYYHVRTRKAIADEIAKVFKLERKRHEKIGRAR